MKNTSKKAASFTLTGEVTEIYNGAKQNDYVTVKVNLGEYYDLFRVICDKSAGVEVGDKCVFSGTVSTFWNKEKKVTNYNFYAENIKEA